MPDINIKDNLSFKDKRQFKSGGIWAKTEVIAGYGDVFYNPNGKSTLSEVIFTESNIVPIGGVSYVMQNVLVFLKHRLKYLHFMTKQVLDYLILILLQKNIIKHLRVIKILFIDMDISFSFMVLVLQVQQKMT